MQQNAPSEMSAGHSEGLTCDKSPGEGEMEWAEAMLKGIMQESLKTVEKFTHRFRLLEKTVTKTKSCILLCHGKVVKNKEYTLKAARERDITLKRT